MNINKLIVAVACAGLFGCKNEPKKSPEPATVAKAEAPASKPAGAASKPAGAVDWSAPVKRGGAFTIDDETMLTKVIAAPKSYEGKTVKVRGKVERACLKKGCWMELRADGTEGGMRIRFKDYGFFVPLDSAGSAAVVEGEVVVRTLDEPTAKHLEEEGAKITRNDEGAAVEVGLVATAVELTRS